MSSYANWQGNFKKLYGGYSDPLPSDNTIAQYLEFIPQAKRPGESFTFSVRLGFEHGVTHDVSRTAYAMNSAVDSIVLPATLTGSTISLRGTIPRDLIAMGLNPNATFEDPVGLKIEGLMDGGEFYREQALISGPGTGAALANMGVVNASVSGADLNATQVINITRASWSATTYTVLRGGKVDIYQADGTTLRAAEVDVTAMVESTNRITVSKAGSGATVAATDIILARGAKGNSCVGLQPILENAGSLFGISAATYPLWKSLSYTVGGAMSRAHIQKLAGRLQSRGVRTGGRLFVNAMTFADLAEEVNTLRRNTDDKNVRVQGTANLEYDTPCGVIEVAVHSYMKQGIAIFIAKDVGKRVGSTDLTFRLPPSREWFFQELQDNAGAQLQIYSCQAPVLEKPSYCAILTSISNAGDTTPA